MSGKDPPQETPSQPLAEAAVWRTRLAEAGREGGEAFEAWLAADERNAAAWQQVEASWRLLGEHATAPELIELRGEALSDAHRARRTGALTTWRRRAALAAAIVVLVTSGGFFAWLGAPADVYRTASGERRVVTLADGSQLALDVRSEVRVRYSARSRDLALVRGQARFDVVHDVERPFSVIAAGQKVIATGTAFNVDILGPQLLVTLLEGRVVVMPTSDSLRGDETGRLLPLQPLERGVPAPRRGQRGDSTENAARRRRGFELIAGERLVMSPTTPPSIEPISVERSIAWQNGQLVFENETLSSVVARVNRYSTETIEVVDAQVAALRISGVFHAGDVEGFVTTISSYLPVKAERADDRTIELKHR